MEGKGGIAQVDGLLHPYLSTDLKAATDWTPLSIAKAAVDGLLASGRFTEAEARGL